VRQILGDEASVAPSAQDWVETGVADAVLDSGQLQQFAETGAARAPRA
jgi:hypothetical protein